MGGCTYTFRKLVSHGIKILLIYCLGIIIPHILRDVNYFLFDNVAIEIYTNTRISKKHSLNGQLYFNYIIIMHEQNVLVPEDIYVFYFFY